LSSIGDLLARYDFNNDGIWDTDFGPVESFVCRHPIDLPSGSWAVICEMVDEAGNSTITTQSLDLPAWFPVSPDIMMGTISVVQHGKQGSPDPLILGEGFWVFTERQDWINEPGLEIEERLYIDNVLVDQHTRNPDYCPSHLVCSCLFIYGEGIETAGEHEIRVEASLIGEVEESRLDNNSGVLIVNVVE